VKIELIAFSILAVLGFVYVQKIDTATRQLTTLLRPTSEAMIVDSARIGKLESRMDALNSKSTDIQSDLGEILRRLESAGIR
jgi:hypothetical protein